MGNGTSSGEDESIVLEEGEIIEIDESFTSESVMTSAALPTITIPTSFQLPLMQQGAQVPFPALPFSITKLDLMAKKIERIIRKFLAKGGGYTTEVLCNEISKNLTPEQKALIGAGQPADIDALKEIVLEKMEKEGLIERIIGKVNDKIVGGWKATPKGKGKHKKYGKLF